MSFFTTVCVPLLFTDYKIVISYVDLTLEQVSQTTMAVTEKRAVTHAVVVSNFSTFLRVSDTASALSLLLQHNKILLLFIQYTCTRCSASLSI